MRSDRMRSLIGHNYTTLSSLTSAVTENWDESAGAGCEFSRVPTRLPLAIVEAKSGSQV